MASGDTLAVWTPHAAEFPTSNAPTFDTRNNHLVLDFNDTTDETCYFGGVLPRQYASNGVTISIYFMMTSAVANTAVWEAAFEEHNATFDLDADGFAAIQHSGAVTVPGTAGYVGLATITFTDGAQMDSVSTGDSFRLSVARDANSTNATDNATGDAELLRVEIRES